MSSDTAMLIRAKKQGFHIHRLNDKYLLKEEPTKEEKEAKAAIAELERLKNRMPKPALVFGNGENCVQIKRVVADNLELVVKQRMNKLREQWPEKKIEDEREFLFNQVYNRATPEMILQYNISLKKFLELSEKKILLEAQRDDLQRRFTMVEIMVVNNGTASTGKLNAFIDVPAGVHLYSEGSKKREEYEQPATPNYYSSFNTFSNINLALGRYTPRVEMWDEKDFEKKTELRFTLDALTHGLRHKAFVFYVDAATCHNFKMAWTIVDAALINPVRGELHVCFLEKEGEK